MTDSSRYIHGSAADEQRRLTALNDYLNVRYLPELRLRAGERVLDLAAGLGQLSRAMARAVAPGGVVGIERDPRQLTEAQRQAAAAGESDLIDLREGDVYALPLRDDEWHSFDVVHTRFLLEHLPDPQSIVDAMVRATRPGGRILLSDDDHAVLRLWPEPRGYLQAWRAYIATFDALGNDPSIGAKLPALLHAAGARPTRIASVFVGACAGSDDFAIIAENFRMLIVGARETILATGTIDDRALDAALDEYQEWSRRPDAALWFSFPLAEGVVD